MHSVVRRLQGLRVADVMCRDVLEISPEHRLDDVARLFASAEISSAPVMDASRRCVGIFSAVDLIKPVRAAPPSGTLDAAPDATVRDFMSQPVTTISQHQPLLEAAELMSAGHVHHLPVVDDQDHVVGIVSTMDIVAALLHAIDEMRVYQTE